MKLLNALRTSKIRIALKLYEVYLNLPYAKLAWQHEDWIKASNGSIKKQVFVRSRGGSKTNDFVDWIVFQVLRTKQRWAWFSAKGGQLAQALIYINQNPYVSKITHPKRGPSLVHLINGDFFYLGIISTSNLGLRLDGIIYDEFEDLQTAQEFEVYPQMEGMMTHSKVHRTIFLGTLWLNCLLNEYFELYPSSIRPWDTISWLVDSGTIQNIIDEDVVPHWQIDLLYNCIPSSASGLVFKPMFPLSDEFKYRNPEQYGVDFGGMDTWAGIVIEGIDIYVVAEGQVCLDKNFYALDFMKGQKICVETGGYNANKAGGMTHKASTMVSQILAATQAPTQTFKAEIVMYVNRSKVHIDRNLTPNIYKDIKKAIYGKDGLYEKTHGVGTPHENHYLDAFLLSLRAGQSGYLDNGREEGNRFKIMASEKARNMRFS